MEVNMLSRCNLPEFEAEKPPFTITCETPLEIEFEDGSIATGMAAQYIIDTWEDYG